MGQFEVVMRNQSGGSIPVGERESRKEGSEHAC